MVVVVVVVLHALQPMRHGVVYMFVNPHSISFPLRAFLVVFASVIAWVGRGRRGCRICRDLVVGREGRRRSRSRARARMRGREGVVGWWFLLLGVVVGEAIPSLRVP